MHATVNEFSDLDRAQNTQLSKMGHTEQLLVG
jgi:hypothetical protein